MTGCVGVASDPAGSGTGDDIPISSVYEAAPYDDRLPTGCARYVYMMSMEAQPTTLITINPKKEISLPWDPDPSPSRTYALPVLPLVS